MSSNVEFKLTFVDLNDLSGILVGETFALDATFTDVRTEEAQSVFSGFADINFDPTYIQVDGIEFAPSFGFVRTGVIQNAEGLVDEIGAISSVFMPTSPNPSFRLNMTALAAGSTTITTDAGESSLSEITVFGLDADQRDNTLFEGLTLDIQEPLPELQVSDRIISEEDGTVGVPVSLSTARDAEITVAYSTVAGTAIAGEDFENLSGTLTFLPGETEKIIDLAIIDDGLVEAEETFFLTLQNASGAEISNRPGEVTITDNDQALVSIDDITVSEAEATAQFTVNLSNPSASEVTVDFATDDLRVAVFPLPKGTTTPGQDYASTSGTLTFAPGEVTKTIDVGLIDDQIVEGNEVFSVSLDNATGAEILKGRGKATIADDDQALIAISDVTVNEADGTAQFSVSLSNPSVDEITVDFATKDLSAIANQDYLSTSGSLTFLSGETTQTLTVDLIDDLTPEGTEQFQVDLSNPVGATLLADQGQATILDGDPPLIRIIYGTPGRDTLIGTLDRNIISGLADDDVIIGGLSDDLIFGNEGDDVLNGDYDIPWANLSVGGNDILYGGGGNDRIGGGVGNDIIFGDVGNDILFGDAGDDILWGGAGDDTLTGDQSVSRGRDTFVLTPGEGTDTILDFRLGEDVLGLGNALTFEQLSITASGSNTQISLAGSNTLLVTLEQVDTNQLLTAIAMGGEVFVPV